MSSEEKAEAERQLHQGVNLLHNTYFSVTKQVDTRDGNEVVISYNGANTGPILWFKLKNDRGLLKRELEKIGYPIETCFGKGVKPSHAAANASGGATASRVSKLRKVFEGKRLMGPRPRPQGRRLARLAEDDVTTGEVMISAGLFLVSFLTFHFVWKRCR